MMKSDAYDMEFEDFCSSARNKLNIVTAIRLLSLHLLRYIIIILAILLDVELGDFIQPFLKSILKKMRNNLSWL